ncbi:MAG: hypothetical protein ACMUIP_12255 [bacterium]
MYYGSARKKRILTVIFFMIFVVALVGPARAFGPQITDVTPKAFSVLWTADFGSTPGIILYESSAYSTPLNLGAEGILVEKESTDAGVMKVTVFNLNLNTTYYFCPTINGECINFKRQVTTEKLYGLHGDGADMGKDLTYNDIVHKAVYRKDGKTAALGAYVLAEIVDNNGVVKTDYPISAAVGNGMPGDFEQNAALNMMNLFDKNKFPLSIEGDNTENIKFTIVRGNLDILGQDPAFDYFVEPPIKIDKVTRVVIDGENGEEITEKISVPMIVKNFHFVEGLNMFSLPCNIGSYSSANLFEDIKNNGGDVIAIYGYSESWPPAGWAGWKITTPGRRPGEYKEPFDINIAAGTGCIVQMGSGDPVEVGFYGDPESSKINFVPDSLTIISLPQVALDYESKDIFEDLKNRGANVIAIYGYSESWPPAGVSGWKITTPGRRPGEYKESFPIIAGNACIVQIEEIDNANNRIDGWSPVN